MDIPKAFDKVQQGLILIHKMFKTWIPIMFIKLTSTYSKLYEEKTEMKEI